MTEEGNCSTIFCVRRILLALAALALAWAAVVAATGGIKWRIAGVMVRSRDPQRAVLVAAMLIVMLALLDRARFESEIARLATHVVARPDG